MMIDARGLAVTCDSKEALEAINDFAARILRLDMGMEAVVPAADEFADVPMLQLDAAAFHLFAQRRQMNAEASEYLDAARRLIDSANERERALLIALERWHADEYLAAVETLERLTAEWPADLVTAKFTEFLYYVLGQQHMGERFCRHFGRLANVNGNDADFLGMYAFAHELSGAFHEAQELAERAIAIEARNPWAQHALSHVFIRLGKIDEGLRRMEEFLPLLETCGRVIHCHDAWHLALLHLERLDYASTQDVFDRYIWGTSSDTVPEQIDAIALLWRAEMADMQKSAPWASVADRIESYAEECFMPFLSAHCAYALARAGRDVALDQLLHAVRERSEQKDDEASRVWAPVGRSIVEAAALYGKGNGRDAATILDPVMPQVTRVGGSDAQNDLFRQMYLSSLVQAGRLSDAKTYFARMTDGKELSELDRYLSRTFR